MRKTLSLIKLQALAKRFLRKQRFFKQEAKEIIANYIKFVDEHKYDEFPELQTDRKQ